MAHADHFVVDAPTERDEAPVRRQARREALATPGGDLQLSVVDDLRAVERAWRAFERHAACTVFQSFAWLSTWQACIGTRTGVTPAIVIGRDAVGELLFVLPLATQRTRLARQLTFLGRDLGDYNAPLLAPDFPRSAAAEDFGACWRKIGDLLARHPQHRHDVVVLDKMPNEIGSQANPFLQLAVAPNPSGAYLTALPEDWEAFYTAKRSSATRRRDRTKRKRLAESGEVRMVTAAQPEDVAGTLETLIAQKRKAFARMGVSDIFARPGYCEFFAELAVRAPGLVHVSRLDVGPTPAAINLGLTFGGRYYHVLASYDDGPLSRFGPGAAHLHELMQYAIAQRCTHFDFTIGDEPYKRDWCDTEVALFDHIGAASARGWPIAGAMTARRRLKRFIKQSPLLWPALTRMRSVLGAMRTAGPRASKPDDRADDRPAEPR
jgi:CelD/BcsL family acetyltransferase involved in cellulose biosynthesis